MNYYLKKLQEKKEYLHKKPTDTSVNLRKNKIFALKNPEKNSRLRKEE
ncbi:MAG: hypothetical protein ACPGTS_02395 [Minisyncoccia bacterium]